MLIATSLAAAVVLTLTAFFAALLEIAQCRLCVQEDPRISEVLEILPGANCGGCGLPGCAEYARAVVAGEAGVDACTVGGPAVAGAIARILGLEAVQTYPCRPVIHCGGRNGDRLGRVPYAGVQSCVEADVLGTTQACAYGCLGFGDCVRVCPQDALHMVDGLPEVDYERCNGCGACVEVCPRGLIEQIPFKRARMLVVGCSNPEPGKAVKQVCRVGCTGCNICQRLAPGLFTVKDHLARIDYDAYTGTEDVSPVLDRCPAGILVYAGGSPGQSGDAEAPEASSLEASVEAA
jgi:Na+-translocating ferredoxin:NAD+ oxidoreductase RNF subunit RnfB